MSQPQYAPQQFPPGYPPQPPAQQFQQPAPTYPPAQYPQQPQQFPAQPYGMGPGYPAPQMPPPAPQLAQGSIDDFFNQPATGGGKSLAFNTPGDRYVGIVTRPLGSGDVQQQADSMQRPLFFKDGRPKFVMKVPLQMQPSPSHPDGLGTWYCKGAARDELVRAMGEAGARAGAPEAGAIIDVTFTNTRQSGAGMNPAKLFRVVYTRPDGASAASLPQASVQQQPQYAPQQPVQQQQQAPVPQFQSPPPDQQYAPQQQVQAPAPQFQPPAQPAQQPMQQQPMQQQQMPAGLDADQQALLAKLTGAGQ